ncbi:MAG: VOC family protein [Patescibacteria group bacterium]
MQKITPFLWFNNNAEEAMNFYATTFKNVEILSMRRNPDGALFTGSISIEGQQFDVLNGGPMFKFTEAISFMVSCEDQAEVDSLWNKLTSDGGQESQCGWLKDKFGLSWQIIPKQFIAMVSDANPVKVKNVMAAMMQMKKFDIAALQEAYDKE